MKKTLLIGVLLLVGLYGCNPWFEGTDDDDDDDEDDNGSYVTSIKPALLEYSTELSFYFKCFVSFTTRKKECQLFYRPDFPTYSLSYSWLPLQVKNFEDSSWRSILYYATGDSGANDKSDYGQYEFLSDNKLVLHFYNTGKKFVKRDTTIQCNHGLSADSLGVVHFVIRDYKKSEMEVSVDVSRYMDALPEVTDSGAVFTKDSLCDYVVYDSLCTWKYTIFQT
ncbi:MAG: hypothetical protein M0P13_00365 [Fibrobacteraceae bacterium]|nr:hypothetical protein [Fibrobacteraceae bacterium]